MGQPINFDGSNVIMRAPAGAENVQDMHVFRTRHSCVSCWELSAVERAEINDTGRVFLSVLAGGQQPPVFVGSESTCREVLIDFGPVWPMSVRPTAHDQPLPVELDGVADALADGKGFWRSCSGCHELNEGVPTGPFSQVMKCHLGMGCFECGGIGAVWDTTDYAEMGDLIAKGSFQDRVSAAHHALFHDDPTDVEERRARYYEESNETVQALGMTEEEAITLVHYTWSRPAGEPKKEIGAAALTLASLCVVAGYDMMECAEADLEKLQRPETIARIRAKRATRHGRGPLPGFDPANVASGGEHAD